MDRPICLIKLNGGELYADALELTGLAGWFLKFEQNGLIFITSEDNSGILDWASNSRYLRSLVAGFIYDDFDGKLITGILKERFPGRGHPRLVFNAEKFDDVRREIFSACGDEVYKIIFAKLKIHADRFVSGAPSPYEIRDGIRLLYVCWENSNIILTCSLMYNLTGEEKYAEKAYAAMKTCSDFPDWNPYHFLDVGTLANSMGLGYDWLYNWMSDEKREYIRNAIVKHAFYPYMRDLDNDPTRKRSWNWRGTVADNWRMIIMGECTAALAVCDELDGYDLQCAQRAIEYSLKDVGEALMLFAPSGAYDEGVGYWNYGMQHYTLNMEAFVTSVGNDFGYIDVPGARLTDKFLIMLSGPVSVFSYHDMGSCPPVHYPPQMMFFARHFDMPEDAYLTVKQLTDGYDPDPFETVHYLAFYDTAFRRTGIKLPALNNYLPISEIAQFRSGYSRNATYVVFHCDDPIGEDSHDHMDCGHFSIQSMGENFFIDLGSNNYNVKNYYKCYRLRAEGHNCVVFNPGAGWDQKYGGTAKIVLFNADDKGGFAVGDLTNAYYREDGVIKYLRSVEFDSATEVIKIRDEFVLDKPADFWWFAHTRGNIVLSDDGKKAFVTVNGKTMLAEICGEDASFTAMKAEPLPGCPDEPDRDRDDDVSKLAIHIENCCTNSLCVRFEKVQIY
ncbi:MAG: heparinase II/III family protein [Clostridia bacterium]|nr:heparinase II/III family protein [Clostridia bacterium]